MSKTDEKVGKYIQDFKDKIGGDPDVDLLRKSDRIIVAQVSFKVMLKPFQVLVNLKWKPLKRISLLKN